MISKKTYTNIAESKKGAFIGLATETNYFFLLDRGDNDSVWPLKSSLTQIKLSRKQAGDIQWQRHFQICGLNELHDLLLNDYRKVTKELVLALFPKHSINCFEKGNESTLDYNITQLESYGYKEDCTIHLYEQTCSSIVVGDSSGWGGGGAVNVKFDEIGNDTWKFHFEICGAIELFKFFKKHKFDLTLSILLQQLKEKGY